MKLINAKIQLYTFDNFVSKEECQKLLELAEKKGYHESEVQSNTNTKADPNTGPGAMKTFARNSYTSFVGHDEITKLFQQRAKKVLMGINTDIENSEIEGLQVQRYTPGQKYNPHYDTFEDKESTKQRWWTVMVYLNDELEGGTTYFPKLKLRTTPKEGRAVIWNNLTENYCRNNNSIHMGEEVTKGTKYVVTIWFRKPPGKKYLCKESFTAEATLLQDYYYIVVIAIAIALILFYFLLKFYLQ